MYFSGPSYGIRTTCILTGNSIRSSWLSKKILDGEVSHPFWIDTKDLTDFLGSSDTNTTKLKLLPRACPVRVYLQFHGNREFFNIDDVSDPSVLFHYFMYKRHFHGFGRVFPFCQHQTLAQHAKKCNVKSNQWVTKGFLETMFPEEIGLSEDAQSVHLKDFPCPFFNIKHTSAPHLLQYRLWNVPWALDGGCILPKQLHAALCEYQHQKNLPLPLWCASENIGWTGFSLKEGAQGVTLSSHKISSRPVTWYNVDAFDDPIGFYRLFLERKKLRTSFLDIISKKRFSIADTKVLRAFQHYFDTRSSFWIRVQDMPLVGAVCQPRYRGKVARCASAEWYNINQLANVLDVMQRARSRWISANQGKRTLALFESILED